MGTALFFMLFTTGFLGSFGHCLGMCGPLVALLAVRSNLNTPATYWQATRPMLEYHLSRISVYAAMGACVGALGSFLGVGATLGMAAAVISGALGIATLLFGAEYLGWISLRSGGRATACVSGLIGARLAPGRRQSPVLMGALNGVLPCGLVYSALLVAASAGSSIAGAFAMFCFGLGTAPTLIVLGLGVHRVSAPLRQRLIHAAGSLMLLTGAILILRGMAAAGLVQHLLIAGVMLW